MSGQRTQWNEATRVQMPALVHLTRIGFTYFGKITEDKAGTVYDPDTNILIEVFKSQFAKLNPERAGEAEAMLRIIRQELDNDDIGESFYKRLKAVSPVRLIDFEHPENNGTIKYITVKNLRSDGILDFSGCDTIDETARAIVHRRSDVCTGDILFASIAPLGRCHLVQELPQDWDINESVFSIRCNKATVTPEYLYMHLQSEAFVKESTACSTGSVFKGIRINTLLDSRVFLPPMQVIEKFSQQTKPLFSLQYKLNKEIQALTQLRDWLLPMLMNGQATVSD